MRALATVCGVLLAAAGGFIAYRAAFLEPSAVVVSSAGAVRETPDLLRLGGGLALLLFGAAVAFLAALRKR